MYVGVRFDMIYDMINNVLDYSLNEAMAGHCNHIEIIIHADSSITISDNGEGLPVDTHSSIELSRLEVELTMMFCGRWLSDGSYHVAGGMHGVGLKAVNALSEWMIAEVRRDGHLWRQTFARGIRTSDLIKSRAMGDSESTGTAITFYPDTETLPGIHDEFAVKYEVLAEQYRYIAYVLHGTTIHLRDERPSSLHETTFHFSDLKSLVNEINLNHTPLHEVVCDVKRVPYVSHGIDRGMIEVDFAFQYTDDQHATELLFVNTVPTPDGGMHRTGLRTALTRTINQFARRMNYLKENDASFTGHQTLQGLTALISVKHPFPQFQSQMIVKLQNPEVNQAVSSAISESFRQHLESNPDQAQRILDHCRRMRANE
jgi:DNA gyrase subunit B